MSDSEKVSTKNVTNSLTAPNHETDQKPSGLKRPEGIVVRSLVNFSESTTFHGYRFIFGRNTHILRRALWILLVLVATSCLCYQITDRVMYYYEWPVTTSSNIVNNKTMRFPGVTVCNLNAFKISQVEKNRYMDIVDDYAADPRSRGRRSTSNTSDFSTPMKEVIEKTMHNKSDLVVHCSWMNNMCSHENFSMIITENGVCYTFNGKDTVEDLIATEPGHGLQLVLNIETYEYMVGKNPGAGVKLIIHEKNEYPSVTGGGHMVSPDSDTRVNMKYTEYLYLGKPHGKCETASLRYMDYSYSVAACHLECLSDFTNRTCGCVDPYMPGPYLKCAANRSLTCVADIRKSPEFHKLICSCPSPCVQYRFSPASSYSSLSDFTVDVMEKQLNVSEIQTDVAAASQSRMVARENLMEIFVLEWALKQKAIQSLENEISFLVPFTVKAKILLRQLKESCYDRVAYSTEKHSVLTPIWIKFRQLLVECNDLKDQGTSGILTLHQLLMTKQFHGDNERLISEGKAAIIGSLQERDGVLVKVNNAYTKNVRNLLSQQPWIDIQTKINSNVGSILNATERIIYLMENMNILDSEEEMELLDLMKTHNRASRATCENLLVAENVIFTEISDLENVKLMAPVCFTILTKVNHYSKNLNAAIAYMSIGFDRIQKTFDKIWDMRLLLENITAPESIAEIESYLEHVVYDLPFDDLLTGIDHWSAIMNVSADELPRQIENVFFSIDKHIGSDLNELLKLFQPINFSKHDDAIVVDIKTLKDIYTRWMDAFRITMDKMHIDGKFYRKNFIHLHISYHDMSYRRILQRPSYDIVALMSDIGGNMGLLVGGSIISIFEVFDMVFILTCLFLATKENAVHRRPH